MIILLIVFSVELRLQAAGDAPILKQRNYKVDGDRKVEWILAFLRKYLKIEESDHLVSSNMDFRFDTKLGIIKFDTQ